MLKSKQWGRAVINLDKDSEAKNSVEGGQTEIEGDKDRKKEKKRGRLNLLPACTRAILKFK